MSKDINDEVKTRRRRTESPQFRSFRIYVTGFAMGSVITLASIGMAHLIKGMTSVVSEE